MLVKGKENKRKSLESGKNNNEIIRQGLGMVTHKGNVTDEKGQRRGGALISGKREISEKQVGNKSCVVQKINKVKIFKLKLFGR